MKTTGVSGKGIYPSQKGDVCEMLAAASAIAHGKAVSFPHGHAQAYDLVIYSEDIGWKTIQVKALQTAKNRRPFISCRKGSSYGKNRRYKKGSFDYLVGVDRLTHQVWVVPFADIKGRAAVPIADKYLDAWP